MKLTTAVANKNLDALADSLNGGLIRLRAGKTVLAEVRFAKTAFKPAANRAAEAHALESDPDARATGDADAYDLVTAKGDVVASGTVGVKDADLLMKNVSIQKHAEIVLDNFVLEA